MFKKHGFGNAGLHTQHLLVVCVQWLNLSATLFAPALRT